MARGPILKNGLMLERPSFFNPTPTRVLVDNHAGSFEIGFEIGAETEPAIGGCMFGNQIKESGLEEAVLVVAQFRPRIRKKEE